MSLCREITAGLFSCGGIHKSSTRTVTISNALESGWLNYRPWAMIDARAWPESVFFFTCFNQLWPCICKIINHSAGWLTTAAKTNFWSFSCKRRITSDSSTAVTSAGREQLLNIGKKTSQLCTYTLEMCALCPTRSTCSVYWMLKLLHLQHLCQTLVCRVILFVPQGNTKSLLELTLCHYTTHEALILQSCAGIFVHWRKLLAPVEKWCYWNLHKKAANCVYIDTFFVTFKIQIYFVCSIFRLKYNLIGVHIKRLTVW